MELFAKFKKILRREFKATLNFRKRQKVASYHAGYNSIIKKELKLRAFLAGHIVAMVSFCATKLTVICSLIIGQFGDTMILASTGIEWL